MDIIQIKARVGEDGILRLELPIGATDIDCDMRITLQPEMSQDEWRAFLEATAGSLADDPIERGDQGSFEIRDEIL